jgi:RNA recognition motif-containing protein
MFMSVAGRRTRNYRSTLFTHNMEEGSKTKKTVFVGGVGEDVDEEIILEAFSIFGVQSPTVSPLGADAIPPR